MLSYAESSLLMRPNYTFMHDALMTHQSVMADNALQPLCVHVSTQDPAGGYSIMCAFASPLIQSSPSHCRGLFIPIRLVG